MGWPKGRPWPAERYIGHSEAIKRAWTPERRAEASLARKGRPRVGTYRAHSEEVKSKISAGVKLKFAGRLPRPPLVGAALDKWKAVIKASWTPDKRQALIARNSAQWRRLSENQRQAVLARIWSKGPRVSRPNKLECRVQAYLDRRLPGVWRYNRGDVIIGGRVPDFVSDCGHNVIEVFGNYWHEGEDPEIKVDHYRLHGYACAVIWEVDFKRDPETLGRMVREW